MNVLIDLNELCRVTGVTPRTVRYYIQQGLLPSPGAGPGAHYGESYVHRLNLIRQWQKEHLPLAEIRQRLEQMDDDAVRRALTKKTKAGSSAADYVRQVLGSSAPPPSGGGGPASSDRSTWERIRIDPDVELHVRRPLSREQNRRVDRLIDAARQIFEP